MKSGLELTSQTITTMNQQIEQAQDRFKPYFILFIGLVFGTLSVWVYLQSDWFRVIWTNSTTDLSLAALLLSITSGWMLPLVRSFEADMQAYYDLLCVSVRDFECISVRKDIDSDTKSKLLIAIGGTVRTLWSNKRYNNIVKSTMLKITLKPLLLYELSAIALAVVQGLAPPVAVAVCFVLTSGYTTAILVMFVFIFSSFEPDRGEILFIPMLE
jgi:hypothetical protein